MANILPSASLIKERKKNEQEQLKILNKISKSSFDKAKDLGAIKIQVQQTDNETVKTIKLTSQDSLIKTPSKKQEMEEQK